jgi:hypothetical protein
VAAYREGVASAQDAAVKAAAETRPSLVAWTRFAEQQTKGQLREHLQPLSWNGQVMLGAAK